MKKLIIGTSIIIAAVVAAITAIKKRKSEHAGQWTDGPTLSVSVEDILKSRNTHEGVGF